MERIDVYSSYGRLSKDDILKYSAKKFDKEVLLKPAAFALCLLYFAMIILPVYAIFSAAGIKNTFASLAGADNMAALRISIQTTSVTVLFIFLICTPVVFYLSGKKESMLSKILEILVSMPTVLPPAVAGIGLLLTFGRDGILGAFLRQFGIEVVFTPWAVILAQFFVASGFYIQVLKTGVDSIGPEIFEASYLFGLGKAETFLRVILPMMAKPLIAGLMLSWTRALGEFGATIMFAGNMTGKTRTLPLQIYTLLQTDMVSAASVSMLLFVISFLVLFIFKAMFKE
jgi:molybdate transport system permease protein